MKKARRFFFSYRWPIVGCLWGLAILLGYIGFSKNFSSIGEARSSIDILYRTFQLFVFESGWVDGPVSWELQVARYLAPLMTIYTAVQTLALILHEQIQLLRLRFFKNHMVICGLGRKGFLFAKRFRERGEQVVIIEENANNENLTQCQEYGAILLIGNATDPGLLDMARVRQARCLISVCGDDGANAGVAVNAYKAVASRQGKALLCIVHIFGQQLYNWLREREIGMGELDKFRLEYFNVFENGARILLSEYPPFLNQDEKDNSGPHALVVGAGRMLESIIVNAANNWRHTRTPGERLRITLVDKEAKGICESLHLQYPQLGSVCELIPRQIAVESPDFRKADFLFDQAGHRPPMMVYVCLDNDNDALNTALSLYTRIKNLQTPVVVVTQSAGLATLLNEKKEGYKSAAKLSAFDLFDRTCSPDLIFQCTYEIMARAIHEDYIRNERAKGHTPQSNPSIVSWDSLPESLKESNRNQAEHIRVKLEAIGCGVSVTSDWDVPSFHFSPEEIELMAKLEHERFVEERLHQGFRYGPVKDLEKKTNPTLVPWAELSDEEKEKDRNTARNISALLAKARFQIFRFKTND